MMNSQTQYEIQHLRMVNQQKLLEALMVLLTAIFVTALLPSLLLEYVYTNQVLTEAPPVLRYTPLVAFVVGIVYDLYVIAGNMSRSRRIAQLESSVMMTDTSMMDSTTDDEELKELEALVDQAIADQSKKTKTTRSSKKTSSKRRSQKK